jgi:4-hydroxybenzoyl-CoA thioesterase
MNPPFTFRRRVRFGDCDPGGVLYTPRIGYIVVEAILDFLSSRLGGSAERRFFELGVLPPARALSVEFLRFMAWDDELEIAVTVKEVRTHSFTFSVAGSVEGEKAFAAEMTQVCISPETRRPVELPAELRRALSEGGEG